MVARFDIVVRRARLRSGPGALCDSAVAGGRIGAVGPRLEGGAPVEIDARGGLATESFVNPHLHLCKVYTLSMIDDEAARAYQSGGDMGQAMKGIELAARVKENYAEGWILENAPRALALAPRHGPPHVRPLIDADGKAKLEGTKAALRPREEFPGG